MKGNSCTFTSVFYGIFQGKCHVPSVGGNRMVGSGEEKPMTTSGCDFKGCGRNSESETGPTERRAPAADRTAPFIIINIALMLTSE